jgi:hypothetical protein
MTERTPEMPSSFKNFMPTKILNQTPNPRTVRACDFSWFNTRGNTIIKTDYNKCQGNIDTHMYPWGILPEPKNTPFNLKEWGNNCQSNGKCDLFTRFDMYGLNSKCKEISRCSSKNTNSNMYSGYMNPN